MRAPAAVPAPAASHRIAAPAEIDPAPPVAGQDGARPSLASLLLAEQVQALYRNGPYTALAAILAAASFWISYYLYTRDASVFVWAAFVHAMQIGRLVLLLAWQRAGKTDTELASWLNRYLWLLGGAAFAWGLAAGMLLQRAGAVEVVLLLVVLLGMASTGLAAVSGCRPAIGAWLVPLLLPVAVGLLWRGDAVHVALGGLTLLYLGATLAYALHQHETGRRAIAAQHQNALLVEQLRHQKELADRANQEKSRFLASASHDLRQPMHALGLFASALERRTAGGAEQELVRNLNRCIESLDRSFNAMLDVSRLDAGVVEPQVQSFAIRDVFRRLHMHFAGQAEAVGLQLRFKPGGKFVASDPQLLERILANLIQNAIKYTRQGGVAVVARGQGASVDIEVWDTGIGIPAEELPRVFDEFYQIGNPERDRARGLGMGLAIVKRLVLLLDHPLEVVSRRARGTMFRVRVPRTDVDAFGGMALGAETVPQQIGDMRTLLVIDDEEVIREGTRVMLGQLGYEVITAGSTEEACSVAVRHGELVHAMLCDLRLANGEDGLEAIDAVRKALHQPLPAVLLTGDTSLHQVKRAHESGSLVLFKPVQPKELLAAVRRLTG